MKDNMYRLKGKFTQKWLMDSDDYYLPIRLRLHSAIWKYLDGKYHNLLPMPDSVDTDEILEYLRSDKYKEEERKLLESPNTEERAYIVHSNGWDDFGVIFDSINSLNRSFAILLEAVEPLTSMALVRLQLDNLTYLMAELQYPFQILHKVYEKGRRLSQITINGKKLNPSEIRKDYEAKYPNQNIHTLYDRYSGFVHPDSIQNQYANVGYYYKWDGDKNDYKKKIPDRVLKDLRKDMIEINQIIINLLKCQIFAYNTGIIDRVTNQ